MTTYADCYREAKAINPKGTEEQVIQMANGMWQGVCLIAAMRSIENRLFSDSAGYKGLRSLINQASRMCERVGI